MIVGHWTFDDPLSIGKDSSGLAHHATPANVSLVRPLHSGPGSAAAFNGTSSYLTVANDTTLRPGSNSFSVEFWYQGAANGMIIHKDGSWAVWMDGVDMLASITDERAGTAQGVVVALPDFTERSHVVVTFDRGIHQVRASVNGEDAEAFDMGELAKVRSTGAIEIGRRGLGEYLAGTLDNLVYRLGTLTDDTIDSIYDKGIIHEDYLEVVNRDLPVLNLAFFTPDHLDPTLTMTVEDLALDDYTESITVNGVLDPAATTLWSGDVSAIQGAGNITVPVTNAESVEFVVDGLKSDTGEILNVTFDDLSSVAATGVLGGLDVGGTVFDVAGFAHVVLRFRDAATDVIINGVLEGTVVAPGARTSTGITILSGYTGPLSHFAAYDVLLPYATAEIHHSIARSGRYILQAVENTSPPSILGEDYTPYNYDWTVTSA